MDKVINSITTQGFMSPKGVRMYTAPSGKTGYIDNLKINNEKMEDYTVSLFRYTQNSSQRVLIYRKELQAGDTLLDDDIYKLKSGDYLFAVSSSTVSYIINGTESITTG